MSVNIHYYYYYYYKTGLGGGGQADVSAGSVRDVVVSTVACLLFDRCWRRWSGRCLCRKCWRTSAVWRAAISWSPRSRPPPTSLSESGTCSKCRRKSECALHTLQCFTYFTVLYILYSALHTLQCFTYSTVLYIAVH